MHGRPPDLTPEILLQAYRQGVFPMAERQDDARLFWFDPVWRGILPMDGVHLSRSLRRRLLAAPFRLSLNEDFAGVLRGCADRPETWINAPITALFTALHARGAAHSIEVWDGPALVGGVYGLAIGGAFCGESMFSRRKDASKIALVTLVAHLRRCGFALFDTQYLTAHLASLGGVEIPRKRYHARLAEALKLDADIRACRLPDPQDVVQLITQRS
ncbi:MAG: leucyl/phenylalanyl-tRNA--protein transferase [Rhodobacteraceae bacterium]|nr:MAG: leucyl/phenylalanyl-tRNA--protein transferase [Paracoccaceae bacterium]